MITHKLQIRGAQKVLNYHTGNSVHRLFRKLPSSTIHRLSESIQKEAWRHGLTYTNERGKTTLITLTLRPRVMDRKKRNEAWRVVRVLDGAFRKVARLYFEDPRLFDLLPFTPRERTWLSILKEPGFRPGRLATRWDANTTFGDQDWREGFSFFEVNGVGVGGLWYGPACAEVSLKTVVPELRRLDPGFHPLLHHDMRRLLLDLLLAQRRKLARRGGHLAFVMERASGSNFVEFECFARIYRKLGFPTIVTEPTDFALRGKELYAHGKKVDLLYRDTTLSELCDFEAKGFDLTPLRLAFRRGQVISSLEGEFDHKSVFEVFSSPEFARAFTAKERKLFKRHILWTRLLGERKTANERGKSIDLIPFVLKNQSDLVLKPNRLYGGKGVVFGVETPPRAWERKIESALTKPGEWVIQKLGSLRKKRFFRPLGRGTNERDLFVVSGFFATEKGLGVVGRMSENKVVNVAQQGGLTPILLIP